MTKLFVQPREGVTLRRPAPDRRAIPAAGAFVPDNQFWRRRLRDGDAIEAVPPADAVPSDAAPVVALPEEG